MLIRSWLAACLAAAVFAQSGPGERNVFTTGQNGCTAAVYGVPPRGHVDHLMLTHARRDVWPENVSAAEVYVPRGEYELYTEPMKFWRTFATERFHDYEARSSKWPVRPLAAKTVTPVHHNDLITCGGLEFRVIDTPGFTAHAVSYVSTINGRRMAFVGDLMYGEGQLLDIYSLQDSVSATKTRGYHGYAARAAALLGSLRRLELIRPDVIVPARGPWVERPMVALAKLIRRLEALLYEHFTTDALRWYWGDENLLTRAGKILGDGPKIDWMEMSEQRPLPAWVTAIQNSRLLHSASGSAFLIDCGNAKILAEVQRHGKKVEGIFITHYHDDHTDHAQAAAGALGAPVYASPELAGILRNPRAYRMPAMTANPITSLVTMPEGAKVRWHEFEFTYLYYPGQTLYHGGLLVKKDGGETLFFVGDTFTPSGVDDYCLQNRNLLDDDQGYLYCLRKLREMPTQPWLINQHVAPMFRFTPAQISRMETSLRKRRELLRELTPFPHPNFAVDEQWAWFEPYEATARPGQTIELHLRLTNHAARQQTFRVNGRKLTLAARATRSVPVKVTVPAAAADFWIATASIQVGEWKLTDWAEAMVQISR